MHLGLVLTGGGARSAYQVGAVRALAELAPPGPIPFDVLAGISAGAINTAALASGAEDFRRSAERLAKTWMGLTPASVYRTGTLGLAGIGARWILGLSSGGLAGAGGINYLLDASPLRALLAREIPVARIRRHLRSGRLRGVAISATSYQTGTGVSFFDAAPEVAPWTRAARVGVRARLTLDHVMASASIPVFFPPVRIGRAHFGDGCVRMGYPLSPAIHLGADRILAIGVRHQRGPGEPCWRAEPAGAGPLPISSIAGVLLDSAFLDALDADTERLERINRTLSLVPRERLSRGEADVRPVEALVLRPSTDLGQLATGEYRRFPAMLRYLLRGVGAQGRAGADLLSYLAFEPVYVRRVMELGYRDTLARRGEIERFLRGAAGAGEPAGALAG
ncbi:MAG TPA: patatin-like phospholipase family protein [Anaeromyxobacter sp.]|nr:patatin-like phospholipase family protein [Anaeromyxobacter sp.]